MKPNLSIIFWDVLNIYIQQANQLLGTLTFESNGEAKGNAKQFYIWKII